ncbi:MAG: hypothetical protein HYT30_00395 [Parcubacteria group bacterium]|nr:hypothetical protein [Parcubacteria group bacterium]
MKRATRTRIPLVFAAALALSAVLYLLLFFGLGERQTALEEYQSAPALKARAEEKRAAELQKEMRAAFSLSQWDALYKEIAALSSETSEKKKSFLDVAGAKVFEARAIERDNLLFFSGRLAKANENDPLARAYFNSAKKLHEENMRVLGSILEIPGNCAWNTRLWYRQGMEYYRSLIFVPANEVAKSVDLIDQAIGKFEKVFTCIPKDRDTEVAIELLYKRMKKAKEDQGKGKQEASIKEKLELMPQEEVGPGNEGSDRQEGRH